LYKLANILLGTHRAIAEKLDSQGKKYLCKYVKISQIGAMNAQIILPTGFVDQRVLTMFLMFG
jgi:hypothetical protein